MVKDSGHNPQEVSTKNSTITKKKMIMTSTKCLCSLKSAIAENGIKYILYLLYYCLFDVISSIYLSFKARVEAQRAEAYNENHKKQKKWNQKRGNQKMQNNDSNGKPLTNLQNAEKDSDTSKNQSSNDSNVTAINVPLNCKNIDSCISHTALEKPTDISTEKDSFNKTQLPINISQDTKSCANEQSNVIQNFPKSSIQKQRSNFRQKFTSSNNMHSSSSLLRSFTSGKYKKLRRTYYFYNSNFSNYSLFINTWLKKNETGQKKKLSIKFAPTNEKKKITFADEKNEKHTEQRNEKETQEEKCSFQQHGPTEYKSHYLRVPVRSKESKQNNLNYKETGTQTDITFSTNSNIEMVSVGTNYPEQQFYTCATQKSQVRLQLLLDFPYNHSII